MGCRTFWRSKIWAAAMMLAPVMVLSGCDDKAAGEQQAGAGTAVDVVQVMPQNVPLTFEFAARAQGSKETEVRARVGGILLKRNYVEGAEVSEGQVLFEIDPDTYRVALNQAKAKLAQLEELGDGKQYLVDLNLRRSNPTEAENFGNSNPVQLRS